MTYLFSAGGGGGLGWWMASVTQAIIHSLIHTQTLLVFEWTHGAAGIPVFMQSIKCSVFDIPVYFLFPPLHHKWAFAALILGCHQLTYCHVPYSPLQGPHFIANPLCCCAQCLLIKWAPEEFWTGRLPSRCGRGIPYDRCTGCILLQLLTHPEAALNCCSPRHRPGCLL